MIPRILHFVWVGDESQRPDHYIGTWRKHHPDLSIKIWGNDDLQGRAWINAVHMRYFATRELAGVADLMRWEILWNEGGVAIDPNCVCLQALPDWLFDCEMFTCWESELVRPGLIANRTLGSIPRNPFLGKLIEDIRADASLAGRLAWETTGPLRLTESHRRYAYANLTILPSHFFLPRHYTGITYSGGGLVISDQCWDSTQSL